MLQFIPAASSASVCSTCRCRLTLASNDSLSSGSGMRAALTCSNARRPSTSAQSCVPPVRGCLVSHHCRPAVHPVHALPLARKACRSRSMCMAACNTKSDNTCFNFAGGCSPGCCCSCCACCCCAAAAAAASAPSPCLPFCCDCSSGRRRPWLSAPKPAPGCHPAFCSICSRQASEGLQYSKAVWVQKFVWPVKGVAFRVPLQWQGPRASSLFSIITMHHKTRIVLTWKPRLEAGMP